METSSGKATEHKPYEVLTRLDTEMWAFGSNAGTRTRHTHIQYVRHTRHVCMHTHITRTESVRGVHLCCLSSSACGRVCESVRVYSLSLLGSGRRPAAYAHECAHKHTRTYTHTHTRTRTHSHSLILTHPPPHTNTHTNTRARAHTHVIFAQNSRHGWHWAVEAQDLTDAQCIASVQGEGEYVLRNFGTSEYHVMD